MEDDHTFEYSSIEQPGHLCTQRKFISHEQL